MGVELRFEHVSWRVGARTIVRDVTLAVAAGRVLALVGESGSGKTTLLRLANALLVPASGRVLVDGRDVQAEDGTALRRRIGYVPQTGGLLPHWTVRRNVALVPRLQGHAAPDAAARAALARCGLPDESFGDRLPHELSGGQRQRAAFARAIAAEQPLLLLDEPFGALDATSRDTVVQTFATVQREVACTAVLVTHDLAEAVRVADTIAVLRDGAVEQHDPARTVLEAPASPYVATLVARARAAARVLATLLVALTLAGLAPLARHAHAQVGQALHAPTHNANAAGPARDGRPVIIASKPFAESYLLAEMMAQLLEYHGRAVVRRPGLGATEVAFGAVRSGAVDAYPEYVGTGLLAVLRDSVTPPMRADPRLAFRHVASASAERFGVTWLPPLGFRNGYALAVRRTTADSLQLRTMSDVTTRGRTLRAGFTADFIGRPDGWPGLRTAYGWSLASVRPLAPALKYEALRRGAVDLVDGYDTDAPLADTALVVLPDDRAFFPPYDAAIVVSAAVRDRDPEAVAHLATLSGRLTERDLRRWNAAIETERRPVAEVAREALAVAGLVAAPETVTHAPDARPAGLAAFLWARRTETARLTGEHVLLVVAAMLGTLLLAVPLGTWLADRAVAADRVLQALALVQTIPGLALLALLLPVLGIGTAPALVALWIYALLPVVQGVVVGLRAVDPSATEALAAMGATPRQQRWWARVPLGAPVIVAGIRTATVITIGTATLAAFVGGGGLGEPIVTGLGLADERLVLSGAIPAALLALATDRLLAGLGRRVTPAHLRPDRRAR